MPHTLRPSAKTETRRTAELRGLRRGRSASRTALQERRSKVCGEATGLRRATSALTLATLVASMAAGLLPSAAGASAPSNDNFAKAALVTSNKQTLGGTNVDATIEPQWEGEWWGMPPTWPSVPAVWYKVRPSVDVRLYIKITASGFNAGVEAFKVVNDPPAGANNDLIGANILGDGTPSPEPTDGYTNYFVSVLEAGETYYFAVFDWDFGGATGTFQLELQLVPSYLSESWNALEHTDPGYVRLWQIDNKQDPSSGPWTLSSAHAYDGPNSVKYAPDASGKKLLYRDQAGGGRSDVNYWLIYRFYVEDWTSIFGSTYGQIDLPGFLTTPYYSSPGGFTFNSLEATSPLTGGIRFAGRADLYSLSTGAWHELRVSLRRNSANGHWLVNEIVDGATISTNYDPGYGGDSPRGVLWRPSYGDASGGAVYVDPLVWQGTTSPGSPSQCSNGTDDDLDTAVDLADPGCEDAVDDSEFPDPPLPAQCANLLDDDGDGKADLADPGCTNPRDNAESPDPPTPIPQCSNSVDDDGDAKIDLADPGCANAADDSESPDQSLLDQFAPELRYHTSETYSTDSAAVATDLFLDQPDRHGSKLQRIAYPILGAPYDYTVADTDPETPGDDLSLTYLSTQAESGDFLKLAKTRGDGIASAAADYSDWVVNQHPEQRHIVYGREVVDRTDPIADAKYLQYWLFYYYNPKEAEVLPGDPGEHEGDWEMIQVRLNPDNTPASVSVSQHKRGEQCPWGPALNRSGSGHPIIYVAHESHANYFWAGDHNVSLGFTDRTVDDINQIRRVPRVIDVGDPPAWIEWDGKWGASGGLFTPASPESPGQKQAWSNPYVWERGTVECTSPMAVRRAPESTAMRIDQAPHERTLRRSVASASLAPTLPRTLTARLVSGTKVGRAVRVRYCFGRLPTNPWTRPWRLHLTLDNVRDKQLPLSIPWKVRSRCGTILHPVGGIKPPYVLRYFAASRRDTRSREAKIAVR